jgi:hypothetical protein
MIVVTRVKSLKNAEKNIFAMIIGVTAGPLNTA